MGKERSARSNCRGIAAITCATPAKVVGELIINLPCCLVSSFANPSLHPHQLPTRPAPRTPSDRPCEQAKEGLCVDTSHGNVSCTLDCLWRNAETMLLLNPCKAHLGMRC